MMQMGPYLSLIRKVLTEGEQRKNERTGVGTLSVFGGILEFDLRRRFPLLQHKETKWATAFKEMLWFLSGECDSVHSLNAMGSKLWDPWQMGDGYLGPIYGVNWRQWYGDQGRVYYDQVQAAINDIRTNPQSRRIIVSAWNVGELRNMALPPCHWAHQMYVSNDGHLDMVVHQRSWDLMLGAPFNIAQYALLLHLYARATGKSPRMLKFSYGDAHIYENHIWAANIMENALLANEMDEDQCKLVIGTDNTDIDGYKYQDFSIEGYVHGPHIPLPVAV